MPLSTASVQSQTRVVTVVRYRLAGTALPRLEDTLWVGETARRCLQGVFGRLHAGEASPTLSGRAADGNVMAGHRHCFYLPTDEDDDGKIDHLTLSNGKNVPAARTSTAVYRLSSAKLALGTAVRELY